MFNVKKSALNFREKIFKQVLLLLNPVVADLYWFGFSVADPGCLSRIPDLDFSPSRISDPGSQNSNKREG
jgi:hypothetical protein